MPSDSAGLRADIVACLPSLVIDSVAKESGQRVVYFAHFEDQLIPQDLPKESLFLRGWEAWGRIVVKVVAGASATALTRLQVEAKLLAELRLPQFPKLLYSNYFSDNPISDERLTESLYVSVEEYIDSVPLSSLLDRFVKRPAQVFDIALSVATGLRPLWEHPRRLVHRDVKPDNLLVTPLNGVVIIDFGIVRETGMRGITEEGWGKAPISVDYAAPEHIANDKDLVSYKTDFFSIGVIMYQLISGSHPFRTKAGMDAFEVATATERDVPLTLEELGAASPTQSAIVASMMEKKPYLRPRTVNILLRQLEEGRAQ